MNFNNFYEKNVIDKFDWILIFCSFLFFVAYRFLQLHSSPPLLTTIPQRSSVKLAPMDFGLVAIGLILLVTGSKK